MTRANDSCLLQLPSLLRDVQRAREGMGRARVQGRLETTRIQQRELVESLRLYTDALDLLHLPVPHVLRDELRIHEAVLGSPRAW